MSDVVEIEGSTGCFDSWITLLTISSKFADLDKSVVSERCNVETFGWDGRLWTCSCFFFFTIGGGGVGGLGASATTSIIWSSTFAPGSLKQ